MWFRCFIFFMLGTHIAFSSPAQVILIRNGEKPPEGKELDLRGKERAAALIPFFLENPEVLDFGPPAAIYAMRPNNEFNTLRPIQTVIGIADALGIELNANYESREYSRIINELRNNEELEGKMVLICWDYSLIPDIARALGVKNMPDKWPAHMFDRLWIITFHEDKAPTFLNRPQKLLYGDSAE